MFFQEFPGCLKGIEKFAQSVKTVSRLLQQSVLVLPLKESIIVARTCEQFHIHLYGVDFELVTGHNSLEILYGRTCRPNA